MKARYIPQFSSSLSSNLDQSYAYVRLFNAPIKCGTERETVRGEKFVQTSTWRRYFISKASPRSPPITDHAKLDIIKFSASLVFSRKFYSPRSRINNSRNRFQITRHPAIEPPPVSHFSKERQIFKYH